MYRPIPEGQMQTAVIMTDKTEDITTITVTLRTIIRTAFALMKIQKLQKQTNLKKTNIMKKIIKVFGVHYFPV